jgi:alpha-mannosidase
MNRIEIRNDIEENFDTTHTWRFGLNLSAPDVWHEEVGAVVRAKKVSQGGHYSSRAQNSRYDWLTLNHFADMSGSGDVGVTLSNADCYFIRLGNSTVSTLDTNTPQISVLAGGRVVAGNNGLPHQGGDTHFLQRFALQTHGAYNQVAAMKFALEHQNPLVTGVVTGGTAYPETFYSLLTVSNPNVLLWAIKPSEEGIRRAIIARVWNLSAGAATFSLTLAGRPILYALRTTHIETPIEGAAVKHGVLTANLNSQQLGTFSLGVFELEEKVYLPAVLGNS